MKLYLSSYRMGNKTDELKKWIEEVGDNKVAFIPNAMDVFPDNERKEESLARSIKELEEIGFEVNTLDLKKYFANPNELRGDVRKYHTFFARGGNTFVLRRAMKLSGFDNFLIKNKGNPKVLYGGFSAGICCLGRTLKGLELVDDANSNPYHTGETIWDGVKLINFTPVPHYKSDHPESEAIDKVVSNMDKNHVVYKTLHDGDVIVMDLRDELELLTEESPRDQKTQLLIQKIDESRLNSASGQIMLDSSELYPVLTLGEQTALLRMLQEKGAIKVTVKKAYNSASEIDADLLDELEVDIDSREDLLATIDMLLDQRIYTIEVLDKYDTVKKQLGSYNTPAYRLEYSKSCDLYLNDKLIYHASLNSKTDSLLSRAFGATAGETVDVANLELQKSISEQLNDLNMKKCIWSLFFTAKSDTKFTFRPQISWGEIYDEKRDVGEINDELAYSGKRKRDKN